MRERRGTQKRTGREEAPILARDREKVGASNWQRVEDVIQNLSSCHVHADSVVDLDIRVRITEKMMTKTKCCTNPET